MNEIINKPIIFHKKKFEKMNIFEPNIHLKEKIKQIIKYK